MQRSGDRPGINISSNNPVNTVATSILIYSNASLTLLMDLLEYSGSKFKSVPPPCSRWIYVCLCQGGALLRHHLVTAMASFSGQRKQWSRGLHFSTALAQAIYWCGKGYLGTAVAHALWGTGKGAASRRCWDIFKALLRCL